MTILKRQPLDLTNVTKSKKVMLEHSMTYNGGMVEEGNWYEGVEVPPPLLPVGAKLVPVLIGCGYLQGRYAEYWIRFPNE